MPRLAVGVVGDAEGEGAGAADGGDDAELVVREVLLPVDVAGGGLGEARGARARVVRVDASLWPVLGAVPFDQSSEPLGVVHQG